MEEQCFKWNTVHAVLISSRPPSEILRGGVRASLMNEGLGIYLCYQDMFHLKTHLIWNECRQFLNSKQFIASTNQMLTLLEHDFKYFILRMLV